MSRAILFGEKQMDSKGALAELKNFQGTRKGAGDYYTQYQNELGVGDAQARSNDIRSLIRNTEGALKGVNQSVAGRTRGQGVNEAQRARLEGIERAPIAEELSGLQGSYADETQNYRDLLGQATTRAGQAYQTDADRLASLESNYSKLFQRETTAAEEKRQQKALDLQMKQYRESVRQFNAQQAAEDRRLQQQLAASRAQYAQQASITQAQTAKEEKASKSAMAKQKAIEDEAKRWSQGATSAANNPRKEASLLDAFLAPMSNSFGQVQKWFGF